MNWFLLTSNVLFFSNFCKYRQDVMFTIWSLFAKTLSAFCEHQIKSIIRTYAKYWLTTYVPTNFCICIWTHHSPETQNNEPPLSGTSVLSCSSSGVSVCLSGMCGNMMLVSGGQFLILQSGANFVNEVSDFY